MVHPRYFIPRPGGDAREARGGIVHAIDAFTLQTSGKGTEWIVGIDPAGEFDVRRLEPFDKLPADVRRALAFHEVSGGARRVIELDAVYVFEMRLLEQTADCPGVNDPVYLYGTLVGPLVSHESVRPLPIPRLEGQLTVSRGDVLAGLVAGARWAFRCADANGKQSARVISMLMGADRYESVVAGRGAMIVYPMLGVDPDVYALAPGNEEIVSRVLYDLLFAWWTDAAREAPPAFRAAESLPVPSRAQHEQQLAREGFAIKGDVAVRTRAGWAGALPGPLGRESRPIPLEGETDDFLNLAAEALVKASEWPSPSGAVLSRVVRSTTEAAGMPLVEAPRPFDFHGRALSDWMQRFIAARGPPQSSLTPGPNDPSAPRALQPLDAAARGRAAAVLELLAARFDGQD